MGFFTSKPFLIATAAVAVIGILIGIPVLSSDIGIGTLRVTDGCERPHASGVAVAADQAMSEVDDTTIVEWRYNASSLSRAVLDACLVVGDTRIKTTAGDEVIVTFTMTGPQRIRDNTAVAAAFHQQGDTLDIDGWQVARARFAWMFDDSDGTLRLDIAVPGRLLVDVLDSRVDVGSIEIGDLVVTELDARVDVGEVRLVDAAVAGNVTARVDVGDVRASFSHLGPGRHDYAADVGSVSVVLPESAGTAYHVDAAADVGSVGVDLGDGASVQSDRTPPGETTNARSAGWDSATTQVDIQAHADVGDITIRVR